MDPGRVDIAIVGGGIAGAALAHRLAGRVRLALLEREAQPGMHSTGRSAAMFMESYGSPQGRALTRASRAFLAAPPAGFTEVPVLSPRGCLYVGWAGQEALLDETMGRLSAEGGAVERLDAAAALARVPVLRREGLRGAIAEPDAGDIDVHALLHGFLRGARQRGAAVMTGAEVAALDRDGDDWALTLADGRRLRAGTVVDAAGAWADALAALAGLPPLGIEPRRRSAFTFAPPPGLDHRAWPAVIGIDERWYLKPDAGQLLGSPANADPAPAHDVQAEELDVAVGIDAIEARTLLAIRRPTRTWAGLRSFAPDGEMVIGEDPLARGFFWLAGQGGWGIQSAAGAAELAAALLLADPLPEALRHAGVVPESTSPRRLRAPPAGG